MCGRVDGCMHPSNGPAYTPVRACGLLGIQPR
jgi:hypothetical protein